MKKLVISIVLSFFVWVWGSYAASAVDPRSAVLTPPPTLNCTTESGIFKCTGYDSRYFVLDNLTGSTGIYYFVRGISNGRWAEDNIIPDQLTYVYKSASGDIVSIRGFSNIRAAISGAELVRWVKRGVDQPYYECVSPQAESCPYTNLPFTQNKSE